MRRGAEATRCLSLLQILSIQSYLNMASMNNRIVDSLCEALGGAIATCFSASFVYPIDYIKTRMQLPGNNYSSIANGFHQVIQQEGPLTLYTGFSSELLKGSIQNFLYFFSYSLLKELAKQSAGMKDSKNHANLLATSVLNHNFAMFNHEKTQLMSPGMRYIYNKDTSAAAKLLEKNGIYQHSAAHDVLTDQLIHSALRSNTNQPKYLITISKSSNSLSQQATKNSKAAESMPNNGQISCELSILKNLMIGIVAGCFTQILMTHKKANNQHTAGILSTARSIYSNEGFEAFFAGIIPSFILTSNPAIQFLVFDRLKSLLLTILKQQMKDRPVSAVESFVIGAIAKIAATLATYPYIMAKLRLQYKGKDQPIYSGTMDVMVKIFQSDGLLGLYRGMSAQLLKSVLGAALMFMAKEQIIQIAAFLFKLLTSSRKATGSDQPNPSNNSKQL
jgi:hypothetical protein